MVKVRLVRKVEVAIDSLLRNGSLEADRETKKILAVLLFLGIVEAEGKRIILKDRELLEEVLNKAIEKKVGKDANIKLPSRSLKKASEFSLRHEAPSKYRGTQEEGVLFKQTPVAPTKTSWRFSEEEGGAEYRLEKEILKARLRRTLGVVGKKEEGEGEEIFY